MLRFRQVTRYEMKRTQTTLFFLLLCLAAWAQQNTGSMTGVVTDPNGAVIPGAKVIAKHLPTGQEFGTNTTEAGLYVYGSLPVGPYEVAVEKAGFKKLTRTNLEIRIAQKQVLDLSLEVGDVQQTVQVSAEATSLETTSNMRGQNLSVQFMNNLPFFYGGIHSPR